MKKINLIALIVIFIILGTYVVFGIGNNTPFSSSDEPEKKVVELAVSDEVYTTIDSGDEAAILMSGENTILVDDIDTNDEELVTELNEVLNTEEDKNIMLFDKEIDITGEAKDLIMALGAKITTKALGSYAFLTASELEISGEIFKDTFAGGNIINVDGTIGRDFYALGNTIEINGSVSRDLYVGGESLTITGYVGGDIKFAGDSVYISSSAVVNGDLDLYANEITIEEGADITGTVTYKSSVEKIAIPQNVKTKINQVKEVEAPVENKFVSEIKSLIWWVIANFILFAISKAILPRMFKKIKEIYSKDTVQRYCSSCGWGALSLIAIPFIAILCIFTFVGSAIGVIGLLVYTIGYMIATAITGYAIANTVIDKEMNPYLKGLIGIVIIEVLRRLPIIGGIVTLLVNAIAFGTIIKLIKNVDDKKEEKQEITEE